MPSSTTINMSSATVRALDLGHASGTVIVRLYCATLSDSITYSDESRVFVTGRSKGKKYKDFDGLCQGSLLILFIACGTFGMKILLATVLQIIFSSYMATVEATPRPFMTHLRVLSRSESHVTVVENNGPAKPAPPVDPNLISWDGPDDPKNPQNWTSRRKWFITIVCCIMTGNVSFASTSPTSAITKIVQAFGIPAEVSYLITAVFLLGYVSGPLFWGPGSELVGRRAIFLVTMMAYTLFHVGQALAQNITTLLVTRFLCGFFAAAPITICAGVIADIWQAAGRGLATSIFTASIFLGPVLGPIISGYIVERSLGWRWVFWIMMIFAGGCTFLMIVGLPETYAPILLLWKVRKIRKADPEGTTELYAAYEKQDRSFKGLLDRTVFRPFQMLVLEPILVLITLYLSLIFGILYLLFEAFPIIFIEKRGLTIAQNGLIFIGVGIGTTVGSLLNIRFSSHYPDLIKTWKGFPPPEQRLFGAMWGGPSLVISIFWLGWTGQYPSIPWYVPAISTIFVGASISMVFISFLSYLVDTYLMYSASAFAANTIFRSAIAASFPLFTVQMFTKLGVNWASTLIGLFSLLLAPIPFLFYRYGPRIRAGSKFAPSFDLEIAKEIAEAKAVAEQEVV